MSVILPHTCACQCIFSTEPACPLSQTALHIPSGIRISFYTQVRLILWLQLSDMGSIQNVINLGWGKSKKLPNHLRPFTQLFREFSCVGTGVCVAPLPMPFSALGPFPRPLLSSRSLSLRLVFSSQTPALRYNHIIYNGIVISDEKKLTRLRRAKVTSIICRLTMMMISSLISFSSPSHNMCICVCVFFAEWSLWFCSLLSPI